MQNAQIQIRTAHYAQSHSSTFALHCYILYCTLIQIEDSKGPDQTAPMCRLSWASAVCIYVKTRFITARGQFHMHGEHFLYMLFLKCYVFFFSILRNNIKILTFSLSNFPTILLKCLLLYTRETTCMNSCLLSCSSSSLTYLSRVDSSTLTHWIGPFPV